MRGYSIRKSKRQQLQGPRYCRLVAASSHPTTPCFPTSIQGSTWMPRIPRQVRPETLGRRRTARDGTKRGKGERKEREGAGMHCHLHLWPERKKERKRRQGTPNSPHILSVLPKKRKSAYSLVLVNQRDKVQRYLCREVNNAIVRHTQTFPPWQRANRMQSME